MRIGLDFDNTIVSYDRLFYKVALEKSLIPPELHANKVLIRNYLRDKNQEDLWTEMQGYVYGSRMSEASGYPKLVQSLKIIKQIGYEIFIISHKTQYPYAGEMYDLRKASKQWITDNLQISGMPLIDDEHIIFDASKSEKIETIKRLKCEIFLDDLPEVLTDKNFPKGVIRCLFDPEGIYSSIVNNDLLRYESWSEFSSWVSSLTK